MPELIPKERLQPSLLDRLRDDEPDKQVESRDKRVLSSTKLQESVVRDISWLLNTENFASYQDITDYPQARSSVVNYGIPSLSGATASGVDVRRLTEQIREAIRVFEPRLIDDTVHVTAEISADEMSFNTLQFVIEAVLWAQPLPMNLYLRAEMDLDTGHFDVASSSP